MFELAGSEYHRGVLQIEVEKPVSKVRRFINKVGPIRARLFAIVFLAGALFLSLFQAPSYFFFENGYADSMESAWGMQVKLAYACVIIGILINVSFGFLRREYMELYFDKTKQQLRFYHQKGFNYSRPVEGMVPFTQIDKIEVTKQAGETGHLSLKMPENLGKYSDLSFALLTDEQMKFYPLNLMRITGVTPTGDWSDPDDELVEV